MKNLNIFLFLSICISTVSFAQEYSVSGKVQNTEGTPIVYANVLLLIKADSTVVKGTSTNEQGLFVFEGVLRGSYLLTASYIENTSRPKAIEVSSDSNVGELVIDQSEQALDEVVVTYQKPKLERKMDRLVFNVKNTSLSDGTIWDLLKRTPSVSEIQGALTINGGGNVGIMINGRKINLPEKDIMNLLSGSSASSVESIEVITNPPVKYSAEGGMLIDIKMKKNLVAGYNGAIFNRYRQGIFAKHTIGTDHYFKGKKTGFSINYSFSDDKDLVKYTDITNFFQNGTPSSSWTAERGYILERKRHSLSAFFDYDIDSNNSLSITTINIINLNANWVDGIETSIRDLNGLLLSGFDTTNDSNADKLNSSIYLDWIHRLKKKGAEFSIGSHYTFFDSKGLQDLQTDFYDSGGNQTGENNFTIQSDQRINLYHLQADYISPLAKKSRIEAGLRYAGITSKNNIAQEGFDRNQPGIDPTAAGNFTYDESIYAGYASFSSKWDKWNLKTGLRAEYTETVGELNTAAEPKENSYLEFFPSLSLKYTPAEKHDLTFNFYRRIDRPRYRYINPFQYFQSNNSVIEGNPDLLPTTIYDINLGYTFDKNYTIEVFYSDHKNKYNRQVFQNNEANLLRFISTNLPSSLVLGASISVNKEVTDFWNLFFFFTYHNIQDAFIDLDSGRSLSNDIWSGIARINNSFVFLRDKSLVADLNFAYFSPRVFGNKRQESYNKLNLSLRKTLWNKRASITMGIDDIFNQSNVFSSRRYLNQNNTSSYRRENRLFTLGFRYKFGNVRIKGNKKSKRVDERKRI